MWFALTQPPYGTSMPQSGRRPQHQKATSAGDGTRSALPPITDIVRSAPSGPCLCRKDWKDRELGRRSMIFMTEKALLRVKAGSRSQVTATEQGVLAR